MAEFAIGDTVAIYQYNYSKGCFSRAIVERDTKLYWIANGRKFRKSDGIEPGDNSGWGRTTYLLPLNDPKVIQAGIAANKNAAYGQILKAQSELAKNRDSIEAIEAVKSALDNYAKTLTK